MLGNISLLMPCILYALVLLNFSQQLPLSSKTGEIDSGTTAHAPLASSEDSEEDHGRSFSGGLSTSRPPPPVPTFKIVKNVTTTKITRRVITTEETSRLSGGQTRKTFVNVSTFGMGPIIYGRNHSSASGVAFDEGDGSDDDGSSVVTNYTTRRQIIRTSSLGGDSSGLLRHDSTRVIFPDDSDLEGRRTSTSVITTVNEVGSTYQQGNRTASIHLSSGQPSSLGSSSSTRTIVTTINRTLGSLGQELGIGGASTGILSSGIRLPSFNLSGGVSISSGTVVTTHHHTIAQQGQGSGFEGGQTLSGGKVVTTRHYTSGTGQQDQLSGLENQTFGGQRVMTHVESRRQQGHGSGFGAGQRAGGSTVITAQPQQISQHGQGSSNGQTLGGSRVITTQHESHGRWSDSTTSPFGSRNVFTTQEQTQTYGLGSSQKLAGGGGTFVTTKEIGSLTGVGSDQKLQGGSVITKEHQITDSLSHGPNSKTGQTATGGNIVHTQQVIHSHHGRWSDSTARSQVGVGTITAIQQHSHVQRGHETNSTASPSFRKNTSAVDEDSMLSFGGGYQKGKIVEQSFQREHKDSTMVTEIASTKLWTTTEVPYAKVSMIATTTRPTSPTPLTTTSEMWYTPTTTTTPRAVTTPWIWPTFSYTTPIAYTKMSTTGSSTSLIPMFPTVTTTASDLPTTPAPSSTTMVPWTTTVASKTTTPSSTTMVPWTTTVASKTATPSSTTMVPRTTTVASTTTTPSSTTMVPWTTTVASKTTTPSSTTMVPWTTAVASKTATPSSTTMVPWTTTVASTTTTPSSTTMVPLTTTVASKTATPSSTTRVPWTTTVASTTMVPWTTTVASTTTTPSSTTMVPWTTTVPSKTATPSSTTRVPWTTTVASTTTTPAPSTPITAPRAITVTSTMTTQSTSTATSTSATTTHTPSDATISSTIASTTTQAPPTTTTPRFTTLRWKPTQTGTYSTSFPRTTAGKPEISPTVENFYSYESESSEEQHGNPETPDAEVEFISTTHAPATKTPDTTTRSISREREETTGRGGYGALPERMQELCTNSHSGHQFQDAFNIVTGVTTMLSLFGIGGFLYYLFRNGTVSWSTLSPPSIPLASFPSFPGKRIVTQLGDALDGNPPSGNQQSQLMGNKLLQSFSRLRWPGSTATPASAVDKLVGETTFLQKPCSSADLMTSKLNEALVCPSPSTCRMSRGDSNDVCVTPSPSAQGQTEARNQGQSLGSNVTESITKYLRQSSKNSWDNNESMDHVSPYEVLPNTSVGDNVVCGSESSATEIATKHSGQASCPLENSSDLCQATPTADTSSSSKETERKDEDGSDMTCITTTVTETVTHKSNHNQNENSSSNEKVIDTIATMVNPVRPKQDASEAVVTETVTKYSRQPCQDSSFQVQVQRPPSPAQPALPGKGPAERGSIAKCQNSGETIVKKMEYSRQSSGGASFENQGNMPKSLEPFSKSSVSSESKETSHTSSGGSLCQLSSSGLGEDVQVITITTKKVYKTKMSKADELLPPDIQVMEEVDAYFKFIDED